MSEAELRWDITSEQGRQGELFVRQARQALVDGSIEVKTDVRALQTGRIYLEYKSLNRRGWEPSGIATCEADLWAIVLGQAIVVAPTSLIREIGQVAYRMGWDLGIPNTRRSKNPTRGVGVPISLLLPLLVELSKDGGSN